MKVSSISSGTIDHAVHLGHDTKSFKQIVAPFFNALNRIGSAIALGEKGDLNAAHQFRLENQKRSGQ